MEIVKKFYAIGFAGILLEVFGKNSVGNSKFMSHFEWDSVISIGDSDDLRPQRANLEALFLTFICLILNL